ncbi:MAG: branched-chain amino acid ABC transporter permease, partial [Halobacteria archaeon]|nr:branched-chain amino acid ABC transporter permease [Halobacteria archaeon]
MSDDTSAEGGTRLTSLLPDALVTSGYVLPVAAFVFLLVVPPLLIGALDQPYWYRILTFGLIWGLFALGYDIVYGYTGMVSFGHAAFFGVGGYAVTMSLKYAYFGSPSVVLSLLF